MRLRAPRRSPARHARRALTGALAALAAAVAGASAAAAPVARVDDGGREVRLPGPAHRIVSLAPHVTETLYEVGAGGSIVGTVGSSDYPEAARKIPRVGDHGTLDLERIVALKPDLIVGWRHGNSEAQLARLRSLGIPVFESEPGSLDAIASSLLRLGQLAGMRDAAERAAARYTARLARLRREYAGRAPVRVFYEVWARPLLTVNGAQIISDAIRSCGGRNVFAAAPLLVPAIDAEAVVAADPDVIVASADPADAPGRLAGWRRLRGLRASAAGNLVVLRTVTLGRQSPRILDGVALLCRALEAVRRRRR